MQFSNLFFFAITQPKMVESAQNQSHPTRLLKIYVHTKFQLIWPSNGQENKKWSLLFTTYLGYFCPFLAILMSFCTFLVFFLEISAILGQIIWCWYYWPHLDHFPKHFRPFLGHFRLFKAVFGKFCTIFVHLGLCWPKNLDLRLFWQKF